MNTKHLLARLLMISVTAAGMATAQIQFDRSDMMNSRNAVALPIAGKVNAADELELSLLRVQVMDMGSRRILADMPLGIKGSFQLPPLPIGFYDLRIVGAAGEVKHTQELHTGSSGFVTINLRGPKLPGAGGGSISALRLMHDTPKRAKKEIDSASKEFKKGNRLLAIGHLEKAAAIDPENFDVASNLGALYLQESKPDLAGPWLEKAYRIDPADAVNNVNFSAFFANQGMYQKAEEHAAAGLKSDPGSVRGRFMLAVSLVGQGKDVENAKTHLGQIQNQYAPARNLLMTLMPRQ